MKPAGAERTPQLFGSIKGLSRFGQKKRTPPQGWPSFLPGWRPPSRSSGRRCRRSGGRYVPRLRWRHGRRAGAGATRDRRRPAPQRRRALGGHPPRAGRAGRQCGSDDADGKARRAVADADVWSESLHSENAGGATTRAARAADRDGEGSGAPGRRCEAQGCTVGGARGPSGGDGREEAESVRCARSSSRCGVRTSVPLPLPTSCQL